MALLFDNISEFKESVGGAINLSVEIDSMAATIEDVAHEIIEPWLGETTFQNLIGEGDPLDIIAQEAYDKLKPYVQRPLAKLTLVQYTKLVAIQVSEEGVGRIENEGRGIKSAYKYQENDYRDTNHHYGYEALERMLKFLDKNEADYPDWSASTARDRNRELFIMYASEFKAIHDKKVSRYVYEVIRPIIDEVEFEHIETVIGTPFFLELKERHRTKKLGVDAESPSPEHAKAERELLKHIQRAIAHLTIQEAIKRNWVFFDGDKVGAKEKLEPQSYTKEGPASAQPVSLRLRTHKDWASRHLHHIHCFLQENMKTFTTYQTWWEELYPPQTEEEQLLREDCPAEPPKQRSIIRF